VIAQNVRAGRITMLDSLARYEPHAYALMRIIAGFLFLWHGMQKLFGFPGEVPAGAPPFVLYTAGPIELVGGTLVTLGLFTRPAAFLCSGLMAAAYWMAHGHRALLPIMNQGELAAAYCFVFLYIAARGSGIWSVDASRAAA
jgi:putative oxidoreductase